MASVINEQGNKYNSLTVIERGPNNKHGDARWWCLCDCGNKTLVTGWALRHGYIKSCGCSHKMQGSSQLAGKRFGKLVAIKPIDRRAASGAVFWQCHCDCGADVEVPSTKLVSGLTLSCGCIKSRGEENIARILQENNISYIKEKVFDDLSLKHSLRYDFAILNDDNQIIRLIEFDGDQHINPENPWHDDEIEKRDQMKNEYAKDKGYPLVRIPYSKRDTITLEDLLGNQWLK